MTETAPLSRIPHGATPVVSARAKRGRTAVPPEAVVPVPLPADLVQTLQAWISSRPEPRPNLPQTIRFALREWLMVRELRHHLGQAGDGGPAMTLSAPEPAPRDLVGPSDP